MREGFDEGSDLVPGAAIVWEGFLGCFGVSGQVGRVGEGLVQAHCLSWENGAGLVGVVTDSDDVLECHVGEFGEVFGAVPGDVQSGFLHDLDGQGIDPGGSCAGGEGFQEVVPEVAGPGFRHLTTAGIAGAEEKDFGFGHELFWRHESSRK